MEPILILGAGLAGLACARHLGGRLPYVLYEAAGAVGGKARTFTRGDFLFDVTGHWLHLQDEGVRHMLDELLPGELVTVERRAAIWSHGVLTPYPFQANTHGLPIPVVADCVLGYFRAREAAAAGSLPRPRSFEDYIRQRMGDGIAEHFMLPYNTKIWTVPPSEMSYEWCGRFVPLPEPEDVVLGALAPAGAGHRLGYNATFLYPAAGGIGRLAQAMAAALPTAPRLGAAAEAVDWRRRRVRLRGGEEHGYRALVSTMPLDALVAALVDPPAEVASAAARLRAASVTYWDVGLEGGNHPDDAHWIYFPSPDVPFYRAGSASAAVPGTAPAGHRSLYVEVSHPQGTPCPAGDRDVLDGLRRVGLVGPTEEPVQMTHTTIPCAYVIMDHHYGQARGEILAWLEREGIHSVGRYGAWTYDSMEGAIVQGRDTAERMLSDIGG